ncbi:MAG: hypothetical protein ACHQWU_06475 [Gemmatimonadales bacterium]
MKFTKLAAAAGVLSFVASAAFAQTATQVVTFQVNAINQISVSGAPSLTISAAVAGSAPTSVTSNVSTWAVTTNQSTAKITGSLSAPMPAGLTLSANLSAPAGATSAGLTGLSAGAVDLVTGITMLNASGLGLSYQLDATSAAGVIASSTRTVTYTITGGV